MQTGCFSVLFGHYRYNFLHSLFSTRFNVYMLCIVNAYRLATLSPKGQCCLWQLWFQDQTKQSLFEYVLILLCNWHIYRKFRCESICQIYREVSKNHILGLRTTVNELSLMNLFKTEQHHLAPIPGNLALNPTTTHFLCLHFLCLCFSLT